MANTHFKSVDEYIRTKPIAVQPVLEKVRAAIRRAAPAAEELISYQIAGYRLHDGVLIFFAGWKEHYALYPATQALLDAFADDLEPFEVKGNTIRFSYSAKVPVALIRRLVRFRAQEAAAVAAQRAARKKQKKATAAKASKKATKVKKSAPAKGSTVRRAKAGKS